MSTSHDFWSRRQTLTLGAALALLPAARAASPLTGTTMTDTSGLHDFDFIFGEWKVFHHKLKKRLANNDEWSDFTGTLKAQPILGGSGNFDQGVMDDPNGRYEGASVRQYNKEVGDWSIWWFDERFYVEIGVPVRGRFENGVGTFTNEDTFEGKPIIVRYRWSEITPTSAKWDQAFSPDGGKTWETNWIMRFERTA